MPLAMNIFDEKHIPCRDNTFLAVTGFDFRSAGQEQDVLALRRAVPFAKRGFVSEFARFLERQPVRVDDAREVGMNAMLDAVFLQIVEMRFAAVIGVESNDSHRNVFRPLLV